jgi:hypothetical protein
MFFCDVGFGEVGEICVCGVAMKQGRRWETVLGEERESKLQMVGGCERLGVNCMLTAPFKREREDFLAIRVASIHATILNFLLFSDSSMSRFHVAKSRTSMMGLC